MRKVTLGRYLAAASVVAVLAPQLQAETLTDALVMAYRHSHLLEQNRAVLRATDEGVAQAVASLRPILNFVATGKVQTPSTASTYFNNLYGTLALSASMTVFDFGRTKAAIGAAKEAVLATREALVGVEQQVLLSAVSAYLGVLQNVQTVALQQNNVNVLNRELKATQDKFDVGEVTKTDVAQAQAALAAARAGLVAARGNLLVAREAYKAATGAYPGRLMPPPRAPATAKTLAAAQAIAVRQHPSLLQAQHQVAAANWNVERARAGTRPTVSASAQAGIDNKSNTGESLSLTFTQPIYYGGQLSSAFRQAAANDDQAKAALMQASVTVRQNVDNAWSQLSVARSSIVANREQVRAAQVAFEGVREEAKLGSRTTLDVLTAEQTLLDAKVSLVTAETNQSLAVYSLLSSMGLLTADHLKLGVPSYDPAAYYNAVKHAPAAMSSQARALDRIMKRVEGN
jgi:outer membrane protein